MDLAKNLAQWRSQPPEQWLALVNRVLPPVAISVLVILLAFYAAGLTWRLLEQPALQDNVPPAVVFAGDTPQALAGGSFETLADWEPFGSAPAANAEAIPAEAVLDAPETRLPLTLVGTVQAQAPPERGSTVIPEDGRAIIASGRGTQITYHTGDAIEDANGVKLHSVFTTFVLLDPGAGRPLERLSYPERAELAQSARLNSNITANAPAPFRAQAPLGNATAVAEAVSSAAAAFGQHIQLRMHEEGGEMIGFRLDPRGDSQILAQLGLEPGDVLTEVNGMRLSDLRNTAPVLQALGQSAQASVVVRRNGVNQPMVIDIGQIQRLADSLQ